MPKPSAKIIIDITYKVEPEDFITDSYGYIGVKYLSYNDEKDRIKEKFTKKNTAPGKFEKAYQKIPPYGYIAIHIGRQNLMHANTKWYNYSVKKGTKTVIKSKGREGIPNIKGIDGNWWNIIKLPMEQDITETISINVSDTKTGKLYNFKIKRIETERRIF